MPNGPPGGDHEILTKQWEVTAIEKWRRLEGLDVRIVTSPLVRAWQTAAIVYDQVKKHTEDILSVDVNKLEAHPSFANLEQEDVIINPPKNLANDRYNSYTQKLLVDGKSKWMVDYFTKFVSGAEESTTLFVTHRDPARDMIFWLNNLFQEDGVHGEKTQMDNDALCAIYFRWDRVITWAEMETHGPLFPIMNWKSILLEINTLIQNVFGEVFYVIDEQWVDVIKLHDLFLSFIDQKREVSPEKLSIFLKYLTDSPITAHFYKILETEGVIEINAIGGELQCKIH